MISVVIPALNCVPVIGKQLDALASQETTEPFEVIVADNGSTDGTPEYCEGWRLKLNVRVVDASGTRGAAAARNVGAAVARGTVLAFTDADDIASPSWVVNWQNLDADIDFAGGPTPSFRNGHQPPDFHRPGATRPPVMLRFLPYVPSTNLAIRRSAFDAVGGFDEGRITAEDVDLSWRLQLMGYRSAFIPTAVVAVRRPSEVRVIVRKHYYYGLSDPFLYRTYRQYGAPRPSVSSTLRSYAGLIARLPLLFLADQRERWASQLGRRAGRLGGSVRAGIFYP